MPTVVLAIYFVSGSASIEAIEVIAGLTVPIAELFQAFIGMENSIHTSGPTLKIYAKYKVHSTIVEGLSDESMRR
jgi:hypothetical protein